MTVEVCSRMQGVRSSSPSGTNKEESSPPSGAISLPIRHVVSSETSNRPKFMITDILSHQRTIPSAQILLQDVRLSPSSSHERKDLGGHIHQHHPEEDDDEIDLDGDISHDEDDRNSSKLDSDHDGSQPPCKKQRKARTAFSDQQLQTLEKSFERQKYLSVQDRMELAAKLNLTDTQVKTWYQNRRTKWKRQTAVGLELLAEAGNYAAVQRLYGTTTAGYGWPYPPQSSSMAAAAAAVLNPSTPSSMDLFYRQQAALQKPLAYRLYPPGLSLLPMQADPLRQDLLRPEAFRPDLLRPELLRSLVSGSLPGAMTSSLFTSSGKTSLTNSPLTNSSSPLSTSGSPPLSSLPFYRQDATSQV